MGDSLWWCGMLCVDMCPAVYELTDDCLAAIERRLTLDNEATQLCNRHQLCYTCVSMHCLAVVFV